MHGFDRPRQALAIALAGLAGFVDAAGFLSADRYFVSFMSGNTTRLAVDLARHPAQAAIPAALIAGFVAGVTGGAVLAARSGRRRKPAVLALVAALLTAAAMIAAAGSRGSALVALVLAMGALNNTFQRGGEVAVGLTYMTGTLVRLGQGLASRLTGEDGPQWRGFLWLWLGLATGGVLGALAWTWCNGAVWWIAAGYAAALAAASTRLPGSPLPPPPTQMKD